MTIRDTIEQQIEQRGPAAVSALQHLATEYGDDVLRWAWERFLDHRKRKVQHAIADAADRRRAALAAEGEQGDGHQ